MTKIAVLLVILISSTSHSATTKLRPGLWEIEMKITQNGKEIDPLAEMKKQIEKMPEAQKKLILEQLSKNSPAQQKNISTVCYTKEMAESPDKIASDDEFDSDCDHKVKSKSYKKIISEFSCKDGSHGTTTWELVSPTQTRVLTDAVDKNGKKTQMKYQAKFKKPSC